MRLPVIFVPPGHSAPHSPSDLVLAMVTWDRLCPMLTASLNPVLAGLALCLTTMCPSYMNDSYFWVVTRFSGFDVKTSLKTWSLSTVVIPVVGSIILIIASFFV